MIRSPHYHAAALARKLGTESSMPAPQVGHASAICAQSMHNERSPQGSSLTSDEEPGPPQGQKRRDLLFGWSWPPPPLPLPPPLSSLPPMLAPEASEVAELAPPDNVRA